MRIALKRYTNLINPDLWKDGRAECTQRLATPIMQIPPTSKMVRAGFNKFKAANLREAYQHFCGAELQNAHSAMADARACLDVWYAIQALQAQAGAA